MTTLEYFNRHIEQWGAFKLVTQSEVDAFISATGDPNKIHRPLDRGGVKHPIIPGFQLISLVPTLLPTPLHPILVTDRPSHDKGGYDLSPARRCPPFIGSFFAAKLVAVTGLSVGGLGAAEQYSASYEVGMRLAPDATRTRVVAKGWIEFTVHPVE